MDKNILEIAFKSLKDIMNDILKEDVIKIPTGGSEILTVNKNLNVSFDEDKPKEKTSAYKNGRLYAEALIYAVDHNEMSFDEKKKVGIKYLKDIRKKVFDSNSSFFDNYVKKSGLSSKEYWNIFLDGFVSVYDTDASSLTVALTGLRPSNVPYFKDE